MFSRSEIKNTQYFELILNELLFIIDFHIAGKSSIFLKKRAWGTTQFLVGIQAGTSQRTPIDGSWKQPSNSEVAGWSGASIGGRDILSGKLLGGPSESPNGEIETHSISSLQLPEHTPWTHQRNNMIFSSHLKLPGGN